MITREAEINLQANDDEEKARLTLAKLLLDPELRDPPETPVYQKIAAGAAEMDADGTRLSLIARHFGVDPKTVMKAIAWFHVGRSGS